MTRLRRFAIAALAATTVTVVSLATVRPASAAMSCATATAIADAYIATGNIFLRISPATASYWYGKATGILDGACS